jgi:hypothetical protein
MRSPPGGEAFAIAADRCLVYGAELRLALQRVEACNHIER